MIGPATGTTHQPVTPGPRIQPRIQPSLQKPQPGTPGPRQGYKSAFRPQGSTQVPQDQGYNPAFRPGPSQVPHPWGQQGQLSMTGFLQSSDEVLDPQHPTNPTPLYDTPVNPTPPQTTPMNRSNPGDTLPPMEQPPNLSLGSGEGFSDISSQDFSGNFSGNLITTPPAKDTSK